MPSIPADYLVFLKSVGPLGVFFLILFKLWSDWDLRRKGHSAIESTRVDIEEIKTVVYQTKNAVEGIKEDARVTRETLTTHLINKNRGL